MPTGLEALSVYIPAHYLDARELANVNEVDPRKYTVGIGIHQISITSPHEDSVTMAHQAAQSLLTEYDIDPADIGMLIVGSETSVDAAKPIAAYVHGLLGLPSNCRTFDTKHACYSATAALRMARSWCSEAGKGRKALVIASDIARYEVGSPGEPTQGAGAVAMLVSDKPSLLVFDDFPEAYYTEDVMDFWRPNYRNTALVQGNLSIESYLKALESTYELYQRQSELSWEDYDYMLFHVPFPKMASKAFHRLCEVDARRGDMQALELMLKQFKLRTQPYLQANSQTGNLYSGALYLSLAELLSSQAADQPGRRVGLFSYGSGCCGEYFSGLIGDGARHCREKIGLFAALENRSELSYEKYLSFRKRSEKMADDGSYHLELSCDGSSCPGGAVFLGIEEDRRLYCVAERAQVCRREPRIQPARRPNLVAVR